MDPSSPSSLPSPSQIISEINSIILNIVSFEFKRIFKDFREEIETLIESKISAILPSSSFHPPPPSPSSHSRPPSFTYPSSHPPPSSSLHFPSSLPPSLPPPSSLFPSTSHPIRHSSLPPTPSSAHPTHLSLMLPAGKKELEENPEKTGSCEENREEKLLEQQNLFEQVIQEQMYN